MIAFPNPIPMPMLKGRASTLHPIIIVSGLILVGVTALGAYSTFFQRPSPTSNRNEGLNSPIQMNDSLDQIETLE